MPPDGSITFRRTDLPNKQCEFITNTLGQGVRCSLERRNHLRRDGPQPSQMRPDVLDGVEFAVLVQGEGKDLRDRSCSGLVAIGEDHLNRNLSGRRSCYGDCETGGT